MNEQHHPTQNIQRNRIKISVIVPVYNNPRDLQDCLSALLRSSGGDCEIIVVDDASTDGTSSVAERMGVMVLRLTQNSGPAAARNFGAIHARGEVLFFVDADVVVAPGTLERVLKVMENDSELAAVFGSYDAQPRAAGVISQYRNLLHHFVHQTGNSEASTFWAGCGAIRRAVFEKIGGFDQKQFRRPSIEDIELGSWPRCRPNRLHRRTRCSLWRSGRSQLEGRWNRCGRWQRCWLGDRPVDTRTRSRTSSGQHGGCGL